MQCMLSDIIITITPVHRNLHALVSAPLSQRASHVRAGGARIIAAKKMQPPQKRARQEAARRGHRAQASERNLIGSSFYFTFTFCLFPFLCLFHFSSASPRPSRLLSSMRVSGKLQLRVSCLIGASNVAWLRPMLAGLLFLSFSSCGSVMPISRDLCNEICHSTLLEKWNSLYIWQSQFSSHLL